jgi:hypothetical protein
MTADLASWDTSVLQKANRQEATADETLQHLRWQFAAANAEQGLSLSEGGPFLKEALSEGKVPPIRSVQSGRRSATEKGDHCVPSKEHRVG